MTPPDRLALSKQLLVEGRDYANFFEALVDRLQLTDIQIQNFGGVSELRAFLRLLTLAPGFASVASIGIVRDAEDSAIGAFRSVQSSLQNADLPVPDSVGVRAVGSPLVSVLILPGNDRPGMLETLLNETVAESRESECIDAFFACVESLPGGSIRRPDKARAHAWLATRPDPHVSVGVAAQKNYWNLGHRALDPVREFLRAL